MLHFNLNPTIANVTIIVFSIFTLLNTIQLIRFARNSNFKNALKNLMCISVNYALIYVLYPPEIATRATNCLFITWMLGGIVTFVICEILKPQIQQEPKTKP
jgi:hypothetical protein